MFEQGVAGAWVARHGMTSGLPTQVGTFQYQDRAAAEGRMVLRSVAIYGSAADRRYAAVWHANPNYVKSHVHPADTASAYQTTFDAETQLPGYQLAGYRPAYVALSGDQNVLLGVQGRCRGHLGRAARPDRRRVPDRIRHPASAGFYPICVQGGGTGADTRYAAIFAKQDMPAPRQWTVDGDAGARVGRARPAMQTFMRENGVRAAQLAIAKNGRPSLTRPRVHVGRAGYRVTTVAQRSVPARELQQDVLRGGGAVALRRREARAGRRRRIRCWGSRTLPIRAATRSRMPAARSTTPRATTTIRRGLLRPDVQHAARSRSARGLAQPSRKLEIAKYMYGRPLDFTPGAKSQYSNYGYLLRGAVVERVTGMPYFTYVKQTLLQPAEITQVGVISTRPRAAPTTRPSPRTRASAQARSSSRRRCRCRRCTAATARSTRSARRNDGTGASAMAVVQFIHRHAVWGKGPRAPGARAGSTPGASSWAAVPRRRHRLGLRHQHPRLAAGHDADARRFADGDQPDPRPRRPSLRYSAGRAGQLAARGKISRECSQLRARWPGY